MFSSWLYGHMSNVHQPLPQCIVQLSIQHVCVCLFEPLMIALIWCACLYESYTSLGNKNQQGSNKLIVMSQRFMKIRLLIIIMYIKYVLINALNAHILHTNLNTISYTHVEHSPTNTVYIRYYMETHTHPHPDCSRNWVLIYMCV